MTGPAGGRPRGSGPRQQLRQGLHIVQMDIHRLKNSWTVSAKKYTPDGRFRKRLASEYPERNVDALRVTINRIENMQDQLYQLEKVCRDALAVLLEGQAGG